MAARLTDKQRKKIVARFLECQNKSQVAREFGVSQTTVVNCVKKQPDCVEKLKQKKEQNTLDMFAYLDGQKGKIQTLLTNIIAAMDDPEKLARANIRDLATAYGIIIDKATQTTPKETEELLQRARDVLGGINGAIK